MVDYVRELRTIPVLEFLCIKKQQDFIYIFTYQGFSQEFEKEWLYSLFVRLQFYISMHMIVLIAFSTFYSGIQPELLNVCKIDINM